MRKHRVVAACVLVLLISCSALASEPVLPVRKDVLITVVKSGQGISVTTSEALARELESQGFTVALIDSLPGRPFEYFGAHSSLKHLIADINSTTTQGVEATVYTRDVATPRTFQAKSQEALVSKISAYLGSESMVLQQIQTRPVGTGPVGAGSGRSQVADAFSKHMNEGIRSLLVEKDTNTAIREFTEAARLRPQDAVPYFNLARAYGQAGNQELRIKNIEEGLLRDPENKALKNEKALILIDKKEFREAISVLKELPADDPVVAWNLWFAYRNIGENDNAVAELKRIIEVQADSRIATSAEKQLHELEDDAARLSTMRRSLWIALLGLGCVAVIGTIILLARFASRGSTKQKPTKPADVLALKVQIIVTAISCVFGLLTVVLPRIIK